MADSEAQAGLACGDCLLCSSIDKKSSHLEKIKCSMSHTGTIGDRTEI